MKTLNITFSEAEFRKLKKAKKEYNNLNNVSWRVFILNKTTKGVSEKR